MRRMGNTDIGTVSKVLSKADILSIRKTIDEGVFVDDKAYAYVADIVSSTRDPAAYGLKSVAPLIAYGASPRASVGLIRASKALAAMSDRDFVVPEDIKAVAMEILRHRIGLSFEALSLGVSPDSVIETVLSEIPVP